MSRPRRAQRRPAWSVTHRRSLPAPEDVAGQTKNAACASCGRSTADTVLGESLSVPLRDGGRRLAPPMPLCATCRREVLGRRAWVPTWCARCEGWRPTAHQHDETVAAA